MDFNEYQSKARSTAFYPNVGHNPIYPTLGLSGEAGEVADKVKKVIRDNDGIFDDKIIQAIMYELGDVMWYVAQISSELGIELNDIAESNINKLSSRAKRNRLGGDGDNR